MYVLTVVNMDDLDEKFSVSSFVDMDEFRDEFVNAIDEAGLNPGGRYMFCPGDNRPDTPKELLGIEIDLHGDSDNSRALQLEGLAEWFECEHKLEADRIKTEHAKVIFEHFGVSWHQEIANNYRGIWKDFKTFAIDTYIEQTKEIGMFKNYIDWDRLSADEEENYEQLDVKEGVLIFSF